MGLRRAIDRAGARLLRRLPDGVLAKLAGRPVVVDGRTLDPHVQLSIRAYRVMRRPPLESLSPEGARAEYLRSLDLMAPPLLKLAAVEDTVAAGVPVRIYTPRDLPRPAGLLVYLHGGGGVIGDVDAADPPCRILAEAGRVKVISVEYRMGPEHPYPAALDDARAVYRWAVDNAEALGSRPDRVGIGGDSYGGTLSALVAQAALTGEVPSPALALLFYPATDFTRVGGSRDTFAQGFLLDRTLMDWFAELCFRDPSDKPGASPLLAATVAGLCPTALYTAGFDPLRDEGDEYAARLAREGVAVTHASYSGLVHGYISFTAVVPAAHAAVLDAAAAVRRHLSC